jgi:diguanylate cyclase (GGDEF)-like protein
VPVTVLLLEFVVLPGTGDTTGWSLRLLVALYPLLDILLIAALLWLFATPTTSGPWLHPMLLGVFLTGVADVLLAADLLETTSIQRRLVESTYPLAWALLVVGVVMGAASEPRTQSRSFLQWGRVALLSLGIVLGPVAVALAAVGPHPLPTAGLAIATTLSAVIIVARMVPIVVQLERTTERLDAAQQQLRDAATHDPLTGLLNRTFLSEMIADPDKHRFENVALVSLDLDGFKEVNDTLGHAAGDEVLKVVASRIRELTRPDDQVVRMGGDEFLVVAYGVGESEMTSLMQRLLVRISEPIAFHGATAQVSASAGISVVEPNASADELSAALSSSDEAMYAAKRSGPGRLVVHHT